MDKPLYILVSIYDVYLFLLFHINFFRSVGSKGVEITFVYVIKSNISKSGCRQHSGCGDHLKNLLGSQQRIYMY